MSSCNQFNLPIPQQGELYMRFVDQEFNCKDILCDPNSQFPKGYVQYPITQHLVWLYQSVCAMGKGDIAMFAGDFQIFDSGGGNNYYKGGFLQALKDAMQRGATILMLYDEYFIGNYPSECSVGLYSNVLCYLAWAQINGLYKFSISDPDVKANGGQFVYFKMPLDPTINHDLNAPPFQSGQSGNATLGPHCHCKVISFYLPSKGLCSVFKGAWNINTMPTGNNMKETGFGFTGVLNDDWAQYHLWRDYSLFNMLKNFYSKYSPTIASAGEKVLPLMKNLMLDKKCAPKQPITVPKVYLCGPDFCSDKFGCGGWLYTPGARETKGCNNANEDWIKAMDVNVDFTFGVDPPPLSGFYPWQYGANNWDEEGIHWPYEFIYGMALLVRLINNAGKYVKTCIHGQCLDASCSCEVNDKGKVTSFDNGIFPGTSRSWNIIPEIEMVIHAMLQRGTYWFAIQNQGWSNPGNDSIAKKIENIPKEAKYFYPKNFAVCGQENGINGPLTHDKLWISDKAVLLSSGHPVFGHIAGKWQHLLNENLLIENGPQILNYVNNHWNMLWKCAQYETTDQVGFDGGSYDKSNEKYGKDLQDMTCPNNQTGCCMNQYMQSAPKWKFGDCKYNGPIPQQVITMSNPKKTYTQIYGCCYEDKYGTYIAEDDCKLVASEFPKITCPSKPKSTPCETTFTPSPTTPSPTTPSPILKGNIYKIKTGKLSHPTADKKLLTGYGREPVVSENIGEISPTDSLFNFKIVGVLTDGIKFGLFLKGSNVRKNLFKSLEVQGEDKVYSLKIKEITSSGMIMGWMWNLPIIWKEGKEYSIKFISSPPKPSKKDNKELWIILGVLGGAILILIILYILFQKK